MFRSCQYLFWMLFKIQKSTKVSSYVNQLALYNRFILFSKTLQISVLQYLFYFKLLSHIYISLTTTTICLKFTTDNQYDYVNEK